MDETIGHPMIVQQPLNQSMVPTTLEKSHWHAIFSFPLFLAEKFPKKRQANGLFPMEQVKLGNFIRHGCR